MSDEIWGKLPTISDYYEPDPRDAQLEIAIRALEFYAERAVYYKSRQFPGDDGEIECSDIAEDALKQIRSDDDT